MEIRKELIELTKQIESLAQSDEIFRSVGGEEKKYSKYRPYLDKIQYLAMIVSHNIDDTISYVPDLLNPLPNTLNNIIQNLRRIIDTPLSKYLSVDSQFEGLRNGAVSLQGQVLPIITLTKAILSIAEPDKDYIRLHIQNFTEEKKQEIAETIKEEVQRQTGEANALINKAKEALEGISLLTIQKIFGRKDPNSEEADNFIQVDEYQKKRNLWGWVVIIGVFLLIGCLFCLAFFWTPGEMEDWTPKVAYEILIRSALLSIPIAFVRFALRMYKSVTHIQTRYAHRVKLVSAIPAFVNSNLDDEFKQQIVDKLVNAIVQYDDSGILPKGSEQSSPIGTIINAFEGTRKPGE